MKIGNPADKITPPVVNGTTTAPTQGKAPNAKARPVAPPSDASATVALSNTASALLATASSAEFDGVKVDRVSQAIENGTFKPDAGKIADKLIANAREVLGQVTA
jgi:negative regulator of flagellin synthesis FlgM